MVGVENLWLFCGAVPVDSGHLAWFAISDGIVIQGLGTKNRSSAPGESPPSSPNARMRHPQWEWCTQRPLKVGHSPGLLFDWLRGGMDR